MDVLRLFHDVSDKIFLNISLHIEISIFIIPRAKKRTRFEKNVPNLLISQKNIRRISAERLESSSVCCSIFLTTSSSSFARSHKVEEIICSLMIEVSWANFNSAFAWSSWSTAVAYASLSCISINEAVFSADEVRWTCRLTRESTEAFCSWITARAVYGE